MDLGFQTIMDYAINIDKLAHPGEEGDEWDYRVPDIFAKVYMKKRARDLHETKSLSCIQNISQKPYFIAKKPPKALLDLNLAIMLIFVKMSICQNSRLQ